jgi:hypothetical protein
MGVEERIHDRLLITSTYGEKKLSIHTIPFYWCTNIGISFSYWMPTRPQDTRIVRICVSIAFVQRLSFAAIQQCPSTQHALRSHHLSFPFRCSTCLSASQFQIPFIGAFMIPWPSFRAGELWAALFAIKPNVILAPQHDNTSLPIPTWPSYITVCADTLPKPKKPFNECNAFLLSKFAEVTTRDGDRGSIGYKLKTNR